jgi:hypothetical protein
MFVAKNLIVERMNKYFCLLRSWHEMPRGGDVDLVIEKAAPRSNFSRLRDGAVPDGFAEPSVFGECDTLRRNPLFLEVEVGLFSTEIRTVCQDCVDTWRSGADGQTGADSQEDFLYFPLSMQ